MRKLVMDEECRTLFCDIDLGELRMRALYDAKCSVWQSAHLRDHAERETDCSFKCSFTPESGTRCQFCSTTRTGLISHMVRAHGFLRPCAASGDYKRNPPHDDRKICWNMVPKDRHVVAATSMSEAAYTKGERTSGKTASG